MVPIELMRMNRFFYPIICILILISCGESTTITATYHNEKSLYEAAQLFSISDKSDPIVLIDFREKKDYLAGHIQGAINITRKEVQDTAAAFGGIKLDKVSFEKLLQRKGIINGCRIVIYDDKMCCDAARLWWMLRINGSEKVSLLNGGLQNYIKEGGELVTEVTEKKPTAFKFAGRGLGLEAKRQLVSSVLNKDGWTIVDARSVEEYTGKIFSKKCKKKGRIPGSLNIDWSYSVNYHEDQKFKSAEKLVGIFKLNGISKDENVVAYCRSGVRSAHTTFVLTELLGYPNVYNYDGSWLEWSSIDELPVELKAI